MATRRGILGGLVAVPAVLGLGSWIRSPDEKTVFLFDESLDAWPQIAAAGKLGNTSVRPIRGDRVRQMRGILTGRPDQIVGITLPSDAFMIHDIAREAGYSKTAEVTVSRGAGWQQSRRIGEAGLPQNLTIEAASTLAWLAIDGAANAPFQAKYLPNHPGLVLGWFLQRTPSDEMHL